MADTATTAITLYRREMLCKVTSGAIEAIPPVTQVAFGSGGINADGIVITPTGDQTELNQEVGRYDIDGVAYPVATTARYTVTIPASDLEGVVISEAALVDADGQLCAIRNMLPKGKDAGVEFVFTFDDEF